MQLNAQPCGCGKKLNGLGLWESLAAGLASSFIGGASGSGGSGGSAAAPMTSNTVSPQIVVNPQISPIFTQQFQPNNSPVSSGTAQATPVTNSAAGSGLPDLSSGIPSLPNTSAIVPQVQGAPVDWNKYLTYAAIAVGAALIIKTYKGQRVAPYRSRIRHKANA